MSRIPREVDPDSDPDPDSVLHSDSRKTDEIVAACFEALRTGNTADREKIFAAHPELAIELERLLDDDRRMESAVSAMLAGGSTNPLVCSGANTDRSSDAKAEAPNGPSSPMTDSSQVETRVQASVGAERERTARGDEESRFGDYDLLEDLGGGGMGIVYKARHRSLGRVVALKMPRSSVGLSGVEKLRFQLEAKAVACLDHPGIVPILDVGEHEGQPFFTMKLIEGASLAKYRGFFLRSPNAAARLVRDVARAVHHAHSRGILHRDLKPANILVDGDGHPYITDFGLAKSLENDESLTVTGICIGTPSYMAPELAAGKKGASTVAADIYGLGAVLYELLADRPPFQGASSIEIIDRVRRDDPNPPSRLRAGIPRDLETICLKCLEKDPVRRYASAEELAQDLDLYLEGGTIRARPPRTGERLLKWVRRRPATAAILGMVILFAASLLGLSIHHNVELRHRADQAVAQARLTRRYLYTTRMNAATKAWDENDCGRVVALLTSLVPGHGEEELRGFEWNHLWRACHQDEATLLGHTDSVHRVAFSPDSRWLASGGYDDTLRIWDVAKRTEKQVLRLLPSHVDALSFSPEGRFLTLAQGDRSIQFYDLSEGQVTKRLEGHSETVNSIVFSRDGSTVASGAADGTVIVWEVPSGRRLGTLLGHDGPVHDVAFSPGGDLIVTAGQDYTVRFWSRETLAERSSIRENTGPVLGLAFSPRGRFVGVASWDQTVRLWDLELGKSRWVRPGGEGPVRSIAFSPDGKLLATGSSDRRARVLDADTGLELLSLRGHEAAVNSVAFSPDGRILATGSTDHAVKLWNTGAVGKAPTVHIEEHGGLAEMVGFAASGRWLVMATEDLQVFAYDLALDSDAATKTTRIQSKPEVAPGNPRAMSPDGAYFATAPRAGPIEVHRLEVEGGDEAGIRLRDPTVLRGHGGTASCLSFSPDSTLLASSGPDGTLAVWSRPTGPSGPWEERVRLPVGGWGATDAGFSPDGALLATSGPKPETPAIWSVRTGTKLGEVRGHTRPVYSLAFSEDGHYFATTSLDWTARLWALESSGEALEPRLVHVFRGHTDSVGSAAFSPDGRTLATGSDDRTVRFWDLVTGEERAALRGHRGEVHAIRFSPDGGTLVSHGGGGDAGGEVIIWRTASLSPIAKPDERKAKPLP